MVKKKQQKEREFWKGKNVLVTGADGFVGSCLAKELLKRGARVIALLENYNPGGGLALQGIADKVAARIGSVSDYPLMKKIFDEERVDSCFHLAAQAIVQTASQSPMLTFESNIKGTWSLLEACRKGKNILRIVVASSDKAYGRHNRLPYTEEFCLLPFYPYEASKACADILARTYAYSYDLPVAVTRCANIYGGGDTNMSRIIPDTILSVLQNKNPIIRSDGSPLRDYIYIDDVIKAYLLLAERATEKGIRGEAFNFGRNEPISVLGLVKKIIYLSGKRGLKPLIKGKGNPRGEIDKQYLSSEKAKRILNWQAEHDLASGLKKTIAWYSRIIHQRSEHFT